jgi:tripartite-type tricarboxylate transporter receptor subunit TctC
MQTLKQKWIAAAAIAATLVPGVADAQVPADYPKAPVKLIVGFAPGGSVDMMARHLGQKLGEKLGQPFVVDNRPGAGGNIGAAAVARAKPDGYTLLVTSVVHSINPSLYKSLPFDPVNDFAPVTPIGLAPNSIAVHPSTPFKTLGELVAYAKANPGKLNYSSAGGATTMFLGMALFESMAGIKLVHIPYNGTGPSIQGAVTGQVQVLSSGYGSAQPFAKQGQLRMLGISTAAPSSLAPGLPTIAEAGGVPGYEVVNWIGIFAPVGTPRAVIDRLSAEMRELQQQPDIREFMTLQGVEPFVLTPEKFGELVRSDIGKYQKLVKDAGVKIEQ